MAPTSLQAQKTKTSPYGRNPADVGFPIRACELLNTLQAPVFIERCAVSSVKTILKTKRAIMKGLRNQVEGKGYSFIEILSMCPTGWGMEPREAVVVAGGGNGARLPAGEPERPVGGRDVRRHLLRRLRRVRASSWPGRIVCLAAMGEGKHVSHIPAYGAEMRGGTANCSVVVSDEEIASPLVPQPDVCIVMNTPFAPEVPGHREARRAADLERISHRYRAGEVPASRSWQCARTTSRNPRGPTVRPTW